MAEFTPLRPGQTPGAQHVIELQAAQRALGTWQDWTPTLGATAPMTFTSTSVNYARYVRIGKTVWFQVCCGGTTGGTASSTLTFTLPVAAAETTGYLTFTCLVNDGGWVTGWAGNESGTVVDVARYNGANWGLGAGRTFLVSGCYEAA